MFIIVSDATQDAAEMLINVERIEAVMQDDETDATLIYLIGWDESLVSSDTLQDIIAKIKIAKAA